MKFNVHARGLAAAVLIWATTASAGEPRPAQGVDLSRFAGHWYVLARLPAESGDRGFGAQVDYRLDGEMLQESSGPPNTTRHQLTPDSIEKARWTRKTGWFAAKERLLLYVSPGYRRAIVADADRASAWVLAREPEIPEWSYAGLLARLANQGFEVSKLERVRQK